MRTIEEQIGKTLASEYGGAFGFVCIWRKSGDPLDDGADHARKCTVGEFLSRTENQGGTWLIDGGWGGPPGPIHVRWNDETKQWENGGFCGQRFRDIETFYEAGMRRVKNEPEPNGQRFAVGSRVQIADDLGSCMSHFPSGKPATVLYTYSHAYGGDDVKSYSLDIDDVGDVAWYDEGQLTAM